MKHSTDCTLQPTISFHAHLQALQESTCLAAVPCVLVYKAVSLFLTHIDKIFLHGSFEEPFAALTREHRIVATRPCVSAHQARRRGLFIFSEGVYAGRLDDISWVGSNDLHGNIFSWYRNIRYNNILWHRYDLCLRCHYMPWRIRYDDVGHDLRFRKGNSGLHRNNNTAFTIGRGNRLKTDCSVASTVRNFANDFWTNWPWSFWN